MTLEIVDYLTYRNYAYNRKMSPDITPQEWRYIYGNTVDKLEDKYQADLERREELATVLLDGLNQAPNTSTALSMVVDTLGQAQEEAIREYEGDGYLMEIQRVQS